LQHFVFPYTNHFGTGFEMMFSVAATMNSEHVIHHTPLIQAGWGI